MHRGDRAPERGATRRRAEVDYNTA